MKPHEETWGALMSVVIDPSDNRIADFSSPHSDNWQDAHARAKLGASAPAMARVLLRLHSGEKVSAGCVTEALRDAGVIPSFEEDAAALERGEVLERPSPKYDSEHIKEWAKAHGLNIDGWAVADLLLRLSGDS